MWDDETLGFESLNAPNQIRLLRLTGGRLEDPLHGILVTASLDQRLEFEAVSYVWAGEDGNDTRGHILFVGDSWDILPITDNCAAALRRLRFLNRERTLWIDAVCIDQSNNFERSHQVSLMKSIYSNSRRCLVYLGEHTEDSPKAMQLINTGVPSDLLPDEHSALTTLFLRKYFFRTWIFQELVLSSNVLVFCGDSTADWSKFYSTDWDSCSPEVPVPAWIQNFELARYKQALDFPRCIFETADLVSSDDRDKIFAIMGLFDGLDADGLVPDYELSVEQVYTGIAAHLLDQHRMFHILTLQSTKQEDLPSWVPDWKSVRPSQWDSHQQVSEELLQKLPKNPTLSSKDEDAHLFWHELGVVKKTLGEDTKDKVNPLWVTISDLGTEKYEAMQRLKTSHIDLGPIFHRGTGSLSITSELLIPLKTFTSSNHFPWAAQTPFHGQLADESHWLVISTQSINIQTDFVAAFPGNRLFLHLRKIASPAIFRIVGHCNIVIATQKHYGRRNAYYRTPKSMKECHADIAAILLVAPNHISSYGRNALPDIVGVWASQEWAPALWDAYHWMSDNIKPKREPNEKNEESLNEAYKIYLGRLQEPLELRNRNLLQCIDFWSYKDPWILLEHCEPICRNFMYNVIIGQWKTWQWHKERFIRDMETPKLYLLDETVDNILQSIENLKSQALSLLNSQTEVAKERIYSASGEYNRLGSPQTPGGQTDAMNSDMEHNKNELEEKLALLRIQVEECLSKIVSKRISLEAKVDHLKGSLVTWSAKWDKENHLPTEEFMLLIEELNNLLQRRHDYILEDLETTWISVYNRELEERRHPGSATRFAKLTMQLSLSNLGVTTIMTHCGELGATLDMKLKMTESDRIVIV
jgi:hypothetical protein